MPCSRVSAAMVLGGSDELCARVDRGAESGVEMLWTRPRAGTGPPARRPTRPTCVGSSRRPARQSTADNDGVVGARGGRGPGRGRRLLSPAATPVAAGVLPRNLRRDIPRARASLSTAAPSRSFTRPHTISGPNRPVGRISLIVESHSGPVDRAGSTIGDR